jgi:hypothetical protein
MKRLAPVLPVVICAVVAMSAPPVAASNPYAVKIIDRDAWGLGTVQGYTEVQPGQQATMCLWVDPANGLDSREGGFDFLVCYESEAMSVVTVEPGFNLHPEWEYFTYSLGGVADTCPVCPSGFLRVVGVADINDGVMPDDSVFNLAGCIAEITLAASADPANANDCHRVGFCSLECGDNVISSQPGDTLFLPSGGVIYGPSYDSVACLAPGNNVPYAWYTAGELCITDSIPDTNQTVPYRVAVIDRDRWINSHTVSGLTTIAPGDEGTMCVWVDPASGPDIQEGGFDFLVCYDDSAIAVTSASGGSDLHPDWEYFTYRFGILNDSCNYCPAGFLRLVGLADINDGVTPSDSAFQLMGCVAEVNFTASSDPVFSNTQHTVGFCSLDCGDNAIASRSGDTLFVPRSGSTLGPHYDTLACYADSTVIPLVDYTPGSIRIQGDSSSSFYDVAMIDMDKWVTQNVANYSTHAFGGHNADMCLWVDPASGSSQDDGGFDMLVCYDNSKLTFLNAYRGPDLHAEWEYFTWRTLLNDDSCGVCPQGFLRLVGVADLLDGVTPADEAFELSGCIAHVRFYVSSAPEHAGTCADVGFCALDCGDNAIANRIGDTLYLPQSGYTPGPGYDPEVCNSSTQGAAIPAIAFTSGHVCIDSAQSGRGDVNLNGIPYEIGDAVLMANYIIYGAIVLDPVQYEVQILAMDINCDGIPATINDLVYLLNIITGDRQPCDEAPPDSLSAPVSGASGVADLVPSDEDTLRVVSTSAAPGEEFALDIYLSNRDTLGAYSARLEYDPALIAPIVTDTIINGPDTAYAVMMELVSGTESFEIYGAGQPEPGVITLLVTDADPGQGTPYLPGGRVSVRLSMRVLPGAPAVVTPVQFVNDPDFPDSWNTLTDIRAAIWKRPVLDDGTVTILSADRGDINLNGIPNEVGDAVLFSNFFQYGLGVLDPVLYDVQIQAMDVNCDDVPATPVDLVTLIRIIMGDAQPCDGPWPEPQSMPLLRASAVADLIPSDEDTLQVISTSAALGEGFDLDIYLSNRDTLGAYSARLEYDPAVIEPMITDTVVNGSDTAYAVMMELVTGTESFEIYGAGQAEPGVITMLVSDIDPGTGTPYLPGAAVSVRLSMRVLPNAPAGDTPVRFVNDPSFPESWNTLTDIRAEIWKRPVLVDGTVTVGGPAFSADDTLRVVSTTAAANSEFPLDIYLTNVDTIGAFSGRLRFDETLLEPVRDSANEIVVELIRGASAFEHYGAGSPEAGVLTFDGIDFDQDTLNLFLPGAGVTMRVWFHVFGSATPQVTPVVFENNPEFPFSWNTLTDIRAEIFKRPVLTDGTVEITDPTCSCPYQGDMDTDGFYTSVDLALYIDCLFACDVPPQDPICPSDRLDLDCDGFGTSLDLAWLIDYLFAGGPPPCDPCNH